MTGPPQMQTPFGSTPGTGSRGVGSPAATVTEAAAVAAAAAAGSKSTAGGEGGSSAEVGRGSPMEAVPWPAHTPCNMPGPGTGGIGAPGAAVKALTVATVAASATTKSAAAAAVATAEGSSISDHGGGSGDGSSMAAPWSSQTPRPSASSWGSPRAMAAATVAVGAVAAGGAAAAAAVAAGGDGEEGFDGDGQLHPDCARVVAEVSRQFLEQITSQGKKLRQLDPGFVNTMESMGRKWAGLTVTGRAADADEVDDKVPVVISKALIKKTQYVEDITAVVLADKAAGLVEYHSSDLHRPRVARDANSPQYRLLVAALQAAVNAAAGAVHAELEAAWEWVTNDYAEALLDKYEAAKMARLQQLKAVGV